MMYRVFIAVLFVLNVCCSIGAHNQEVKERTLVTGEKIERTIKGGEEHTYSITMTVGECLQIRVNQRRIDVVLKLLSPDGNELLTVDSPNGRRGPEFLSFEARTDGTFRVAIKPLDFFTAPPGHYDITLTSLGIAQPEDRIRIDAQRAFQAALDLASKKNYRPALTKFEEAGALWKKIDDKYCQALALLSSSYVYSVLDQKQKSFEANSQALSLFRVAGDAAGEYEVMTNLGNYHFNLKNYQSALSDFKRSLIIARELDDQLMHINGLQNVARAEWKLDQQQLAVDDYHQSLEMARQVMGHSGRNLFPLKPTIEFLEEALKNKRENRNASTEVNIYLDLGWVSGLQYNSCNNALGFYRKAFVVNQSISDQREKMAFLEKLKQAFTEVGQKCEEERQRKAAIEAYDGVLQVERARNNPTDVAFALEQLGFAYWRDEQAEKVVENFKVALAIRRTINDPSREADNLNVLGQVYDSLGHTEKVFEYWKEAIALKRKADDKINEIHLLFKLGRKYLTQARYQEAAQCYEELLKIPIARDPDLETVSLINLGVAYYRLNRPEQAISRFSTLALEPTITGGVGKLIALNNLAEVYRSSGDNLKAIALYSRVIDELPFSGLRGGTLRPESAINIYNDADLIIGSGFDSIQKYVRPFDFRDVHLFEGTPPMVLKVGVILNNRGLAYFSLGKYELAIQEYEKALYEQVRLFGRNGYFSGVNEIIENNLALVYKTLAQYDKALPYYKKNLEEMRRAHNRAGIVLTLNNLGGLYEANGHHHEALDHFKQALNVIREVRERETKDAKAEGVVLNNIGNIYLSLKQENAAVDYFNQALKVRRQAKDRSGEADTLSNLASAYLSLKNYRYSLDFYSQALALKRAVGDRGGEAITLNNLMWLWKALDKPAIAIFYGKQAVNILQQLRGNIAGLEKGLQQTFLKSKEDTYRTLADILISQNRIPEAQQILRLLKEQEFDDFMQRDRGPEGRSEETDKEAEWEKHYLQIADRIAAIGKEYEGLSAKLKALKELPREEKDRLDQLEKDLEAARKQFLKVLDQIYVEFGKGEQANAKVKDIKEYQTIKDALRELGPDVVALYTIVEDDKYRVLLYLPDTEIAREYQIKREELNKLVSDFREVFDQPPGKNFEKDPRPLAQKLYQIIMAPIVKDLEQAKAQTLMWSLDGFLRYVPIAALHDGKQYLVERYRNVVITKGSLVNIERIPTSSKWRGLGLGVSQKFEPFKPLPFVPDELHNVIREQGPGARATGIIPGEVLLDEKFKAKTMKDALLPQSYQVVHIASHFKFGPSKKSSFLLLGDGSHFTLDDLEGGGQRLFNGVDLLTLSACDTAVRGAEVNGKEVESFGELAQQLGARGVIATLWPVVDKSTPDLMRVFYAHKTGDSSVSKAQALQTAQLKLLKSEDYSHPYFWAPFILIGNWR